MVGAGTEFIWQLRVGNVLNKKTRDLFLYIKNYGII